MSVSTYDIQEPRTALELTIAEPLPTIIARVCGRIPPLWDLPNYVAVNPFLGFSGQPLVEAARAVRDGLDAQLLPGLAFYRAQWAAGAIDAEALGQAARRAGQRPEAMAAILAGEAPIATRPPSTILTMAERRDLRDGSDWGAIAMRHVAQWCAAHTGGTARWRAPGAADGLYAAWRAAAPIDRALEIEGLAGWRAWARSLPESADQAIAAMLGRLPITDEEREAYLYRLLGGISGWASLLRRPAWELGGGDPGPLRDLLAIRICVDAGIALLADGRAPAGAAPRGAPIEDEQTLAIFQEALEDSYARRLTGSILAATTAAATAAATTRPEVQAVFCIDVRSEVIRRHLEAQSAQIETLGFAGFFGVPLGWQADDLSARCPVLLTPSVHLRAQGGARADMGAGVVKELQAAPCAAFSFVETAGIAYGLGLIGDALGLRAAARADEEGAPLPLDPADGAGIALPERVALAAGILKNLSLRDPIARIVLLCGHAGRSENNPHAAGLDCGACGGHGGAINARVAAAILNDPLVRAALAEGGRPIPDDTWFLPGLHDTSVDQVRLLDLERAPASHRDAIAQLERWLERAGARAQAERAPALGLAGRPGSLMDRLWRRARDWSEARPEWALARNAAFIAARRARTRAINLEGRSFLHEYDWRADPDGTTLGLILAAPMVVASWINLQYLAATVDNRVFGSGTKALHSRVGALGVVLGNGGDLRGGLPMQSVHAPGGRWYHEPLRLQVIVEAPQPMVEAALGQLPAVRELVEHGWVRLFALDPERAAVARWVPGQGWGDV